MTPAESPSPRETTGAAAGDLAVPELESRRVELLGEALLRSWGPDTCAPEDQPAWHPDNPARGQCITTVLVVHDRLGGELLRGEVHVDGNLVDHHWWNRLPDGRELDFTRQQFGPNEVVSGGIRVTRPADAGRVVEQYERLRSRVDALTRELSQAGTLVTRVMGEPPTAWL